MFLFRGCGAEESMLEQYKKKGTVCMEYNSMNQWGEIQASQRESLSAYTAKTFLWMFAGLLVTFAMTYASYATGLVLLVFSNSYGILMLTGAELLVVIFMSARVHKISVGTARAMFLLYSALNGVVFSAYFLMIGSGMLMFIFGATAVFFGLMAGVSYIARVDLSGIRPLLIGGLIFLVVFQFLAMFLNLTSMETIMCYVGILIFLGLTAYDVGMIRRNYQMFSENEELLAKASIFSALELYLDFINIFLYLLRLFARNRD